MEITILNKDNQNVYEEFLLKQEHPLLYVSSKYKDLLEKTLGCESSYLLLWKGEKIVGVYPIMFKESKRFGKVANSLPFFGSNGGIIVDEKLDKANRFQIWKELVFAGQKLILANNCAASTLVTSPFEKNIDWYEQSFPSDYYDSRIGQITLLPPKSKNPAQDLMVLFHQKTRNMIRKAIKSNISVSKDNSPESLLFLTETHQRNIEEMGGVPKEEKFFKAIPKCFGENEYSIYCAQVDKKRIGGLLLFYFNKTVEYYTPAVEAESRSLQPMSLLVFEAMCEAVARGYKYWNWGGTWSSQEGVYRFKKRWNTKDMPYKYFTKIFNKKLLEATKDELLNEYPYFYVLPFKVIDEK